MTETQTPQRGRPRPEEVVKRDETVYAAVDGKEGRTIAQLVESTGLAQNLVFLSLFRLRKEGKVTASEGRPRTFTRSA